LASVLDGGEWTASVKQNKQDYEDKPLIKTIQIPINSLLIKNLQAAETQEDKSKHGYGVAPESNQIRGEEVKTLAP
jgi:hypothetical protein